MFSIVKKQDDHFWKTLFQSLPGHYLLLAPNSPKFTILEANESYCKMGHVKSQEIIGMGIFEAFPGDHNNEEAFEINKLLLSLNSVLENKKEQLIDRIEYSIKTSNGGFECH